MNLLLLLPGLLPIAVGFTLGAIPFVAERMHWNVWLVVPVSGLLFGWAMGWAQFRLAALLNVTVSGFGVALLAGLAMLGYAATFGQDLALGMSRGELEVHPGIRLPVSSRFSTTSFAADQVGALLGAVVALMKARRDARYCSVCKRVLRSVGERRLRMDLAEPTVRGVLDDLRAVAASGDYAKLVHAARGLVGHDRANYWLYVEERECRTCNVRMLVGRVEDWTGHHAREMDELAFELRAPAHGAGPRLA